MLEPLTVDERACLDALISGQPVELGEEFEAEQQNGLPPRKAWRPSTPPRVIRGAFLRALAFGLPIRRTPDGQPAPVQLAGTGIVIRGAVIQGVADLCGVGADTQRGALLLDFAGCAFQSDLRDAADDFGRAKPVLKVEDARLLRVSLVDCTFPKVSFANTQITGNLSVKHCSGPADECCIDLREIRVDGGVTVQDSTFILKERSQPDPDARDSFAIDFYGAKIGGDVNLQPRVTARGGVRLASSQVNGDVWCIGLIASAMDRDSALEIQLARIAGALVIRPQMKPGSDTDDAIVRKVEIQGVINLLSAQVGSWLQVQFGAFTGTPKGAAEFRMPMGRVGGELHFQGKAPDGVPDFPGSVNLQGAHIGGDMILNNYRHTGGSFGIALDYAHVGRRAFIGNHGASMGWVSAREMRIGVDLLLDGEIGLPALPWAFIAAGTQIGGKMTVTSSCRLTGGLDLEFACIEQSLSIDEGALLRPASAYALRASQAKFGAVRLSGGFCGKLDFELARVSGNFDIGHNAQALIFLRSKSEKPLPDPQLSLKDAEVGGVLNVNLLRQGDYSEDVKQLKSATKGAQTAPDGAAETFVRPQQPVRGPARRPPVAARSASLACYPGWRLVEFKRDPNADGFDLMLLGPNNERLGLDGTSPPIHEFNARRGFPKLDTDEQIRDYFRFFCGSVWGELGSFRVIETEEMLESFRVEEKKSGPQPLQIVSKAHDGVVVTATLLYSNALFSVRTTIKPTGMVLMDEDVPVATFLGTEVVKEASPWRLTKGNWPPTLWAGHWKDDAQAVRIETDAILRERGEYAKRSRRVEVTKLRTIDLSNATVGVLRDNSGFSWPDFVYLRLTDFRYHSILVGGDLPVSDVRARKNKQRSSDPIGALRQLIRTNVDASKSSASAAQTAETNLTYPESWSYPDYELAQALCAENGASPVSKDLARWLVKSAEYDAVRHRQGRERWLRLSSKTRDLLDFEPQPFEQLIAVSRHGGHHSVVRKLAELRAEREAAMHCASARTPWDIAVSWLSRAFGYTYRVCFGQGLGSVNAMLTVLAFWLVGATAATYLAWGDVWLPMANGANSRGVLEIVAGVEPTARNPALVRSDRVSAPCQGEISGVVYAADALIPFVDLGEESRCHVRASAWLSKWLKAAYSLLGALVLSLTILTIANSARRYVDR